MDEELASIVRPCGKSDEPDCAVRCSRPKNSFAATSEPNSSCASTSASFEGGEADTAFKAVDDALRQLVGEKTGLSSRIAELDALLELKPPRPPGRQWNATAGLPKMPASAP